MFWGVRGARGTFRASPRERPVLGAFKRRRARWRRLAAATKNTFPSPGGEGGPRRAFSPAVAGRMRGYLVGPNSVRPETSAAGPYGLGGKPPPPRSAPIPRRCRATALQGAAHNHQSFPRLTAFLAARLIPARSPQSIQSPVRRRRVRAGGFASGRFRGIGDRFYSRRRSNAPSPRQRLTRGHGRSA